MPSRKNYKTEEAFQKELKKVRDARAAQTMKSIQEIEANVTGPIPDLGEDEARCACDQSRLRNVIADEVGDKLRRYLLRRWGATHRRNVIIVVNHKIMYKKGYTVYIVQLTAYGARLEKDWLQNELMNLGYNWHQYQRKSYANR